jgi:hypothetical protein
MAEALHNERYARRLLAGRDDEFAREVQGMHRWIAGPVDATGAVQMPWLRAIGTPPWTLVRQVGRSTSRGRLVPPTAAAAGCRARRADRGTLDGAVRGYRVGSVSISG